MVITPVVGCIARLIQFLGYSFFFRKTLKIEFSHATVFSFSIILSIYYIAALLGCLDIIIYGSFIIGGILFAYITRSFFKASKASNILELFTYDIIIFIILVLAYFITIRNLIPTYIFWDDYAAMGVFVKEINIYHGLRLDMKQPSSKPLIFVGYTQLVSIFEYSVSKLIGFKEAHNVFAKGLIYIIFCSVALVERRFFWSLILAIIIVLSSLYLDFNSLILDGLVGAVFGAVLAIYIQSRKYSNPLLTIILIAPTLFILPNIKEVGYWFSYALILFIISDKLVRRDYRYLALTFLLLFLPLLGKALWALHLDSMNIQTPFASIVNILSTIEPERVQLIKLIIYKMLPYFYSPTMKNIYVISAITMPFIKFYHPSDFSRYIGFLIIIFFGFFLYFIFRIDLFLLKFSNEEAKIAAAHERYLGSYVMIFSFCNISFIKNTLEHSIFKKQWQFCSIISTRLSQDSDATYANLYQKYFKGTYRFSIESSPKDIFASKKKWIIYPVFLIIFTSISVKSYKKMTRDLRNIVSHYFLEKQRTIENMRKNGFDDSLEFKKNNFSLLDCYIYNYLVAPYGYEALDKCYIDVSSAAIN